MIKLKQLSDRERAIMNEAYMVERVYHAMGEKESPAEIYRILEEKCIRMASAEDKKIKTKGK